MSDTTPSIFEGKYKFEKDIDVKAAKLKIQTEASVDNTGKVTLQAAVQGEYGIGGIGYNYQKTYDSNDQLYSTAHEAKAHKS